MILKAINLGPQVLSITENKLLLYAPSNKFVPEQVIDFPSEYRTTSDQLNDWNDKGLVQLRLMQGEEPLAGPGTPRESEVMADNVVVIPNDNPLIQKTNVQGFLDEVEDILSAGGSGGTGYKVEEFLLNGTDISNKFVTLSIQPCNTNITVSVRNGPAQGYGQDFTISGINITWAGRGLEGVIEAGDELIIGYEHNCP